MGAPDVPFEVTSLPVKSTLYHKAEDGARQEQPAVPPVFVHYESLYLMCTSYKPRSLQNGATMSQNVVFSYTKTHKDLTGMWLHYRVPWSLRGRPGDTR